MLHNVFLDRTELKRVFPFLRWKGSLNKHTFFADTIAGIIVALILIPQSIAYAQLAGLPPQQGLYAAFIAPIIGALFGSSGKLSTGPVAVISLMTASALSALNLTDPAMMVQYAILLAVLVGLFQLLFGLLRLGVIINFISHPVMLGFTNAAALIIASSQLPKIFGIRIGNYDHQYEMMYHFLIALPWSFHLLSFVFAMSAVLFIMVLKKISPLTPSVLIVMIIAICVSWLTNFESLGGSVVGSIPSGLPQLSGISINIAAIPDLASTAVIIAILGFMESISIAKSLALKSNEKIDTNQEFIGQGLANIAVASIQGYPVSGSFSRSAVNYKAGAITGISSVITGICVLITLLFFTPLLYHLPQSVLSAIIISSVISLINLDKIKLVYKVIRSDGIIAFVTFISTLFFAPHLDKGILAGVLLSTAYYIYTRTKPHIGQFTANRSGKFIELRKPETKICKYISIVSFDGSLFFANAAYLETKMRTILADRHLDTRYIIFDAQGINFIDSTGIETIYSLHKELNEIGIHIVYVRIKEDVKAKLKATEVYSQIKYSMYESRTDAIGAIYEKAHSETNEHRCPLLSVIK
ncbi:MAG: sulfate permease [bacterium]|nr:sulfate permease [bacterium]